MKANIIKTALLALLTAPVFTACELDQYPTNSVPNEESWTNLQDASNFNAGVYAYLRSLARTGWIASDTQMDYFQPNPAYGNRMGEIYRWRFNSGTDEMESAWAGPYTAIANCNNFLNNYDRISLTGEDDNETAANEALMQTYIGEAYFVRALAYSQLAMLFCKDYEPETADTDLGLPLLTTVDINAKPSRASLKATWDFIKEDLLKAQELITNTEDPDITTYAVQALKARVFLQTHEYDSAQVYAERLINSSPFDLQDADGYTAMWATDAGAEIIWQPVYNADERASWSYKTWTELYSAYTPDWVPAKASIDMYDNGDVRKSAFFQLASTFKANDYTVDNAVYIFNKYPGNVSLLKGGESEKNVYNSPKMFRIAEQYLIAAEAAYRQGDENTAEQYIADLRDARGAAAFNPQATGETIFGAIKLEWKREFIGEGQRFITLKRWHEGFTRNAAAQDNNTVVTTDAANGVAKVVEPTDIRWVWEISTQDLTTNSNLKSNWNGQD